MRLVFVNYCHPHTPHVCGVRVARFADAMAMRGHRVVLITRELDGHPTAPPPPALGDALGAHDWSRPFHLAIPPARGPLFRAIQDGRLPGGIRQASIAAAYVLTGGLHGDWRRAVAAYGPGLAEGFRPDLAWGSFGNTDTWAIARDMAAAAKAPWVMDIKDHWSTFIPAPLRRPVARHFRSAAAMTALSGAHVDEATGYFSQAKAVVFSGVPDEFLAPELVPPPEEGMVLTVTGGLYGADRACGFLAALADWAQTRSITRPRLIYAGGDHACMAEAVEATGIAGTWAVEIHPYMPLDQLRRLHRGASVNSYLRASSGFHHKIFELLSAGRPVLCYPAESAEARQIADQSGGLLLSCADGIQVAEALDRVAAGAAPASGSAGMAQFTFSAQAERLEDVFRQVLEARA